jgi:hypothetical protein
MGRRQTAVNTRTSTPRRAPVRTAAGPTVVRAGRRLANRQTGFVDTEPTPSRFPAGRRGDQDVVGSHLVPTFFSLRLRVAQHFTYTLGAET